MPANESTHRVFNQYHNHKSQLVGNKAGHAAPAWKVNQQARRASGPQAQVPRASKILLSNLPTDVGYEEVQTLFEKTIGPVKEGFIVYNNQGNSKGMAIVIFQRLQDAAIARAKYNGKIIDGRRPIKIEIIKDTDESPSVSIPATTPAPPTLLQRLAPKNPAPKPVAVPTPPQHPKKQARAAAKAPPAATAPPAPPRPVVNSKTRLRQKKGPRRVKKTAKTSADLDAEMDEYRAKADMES